MMNNKIKKIISVALWGTMLASPHLLAAGVGIGTTSPDASAILDVTATNQGFLPPRIALTGTHRHHHYHLSGGRLSRL